MRMKDTPSSVDLTKALTVNVDGIQAEHLPGNKGAKIQPLLEAQTVTINRLTVAQSGSLPTSPTGKDSIYFLLSGEAALRGQTESHRLEEGTLLFIPRQPLSERKGYQVQLELFSAELQLLVLNVSADDGSVPLRNDGVWVDSRVLVVQPNDPPAYQPTNHTHTVNRCLFINDEIEVLRGKILTGGGADRHAHEAFEQFTYVIGPAPSLLLYTPRGVLHGGDTYEVDLDLLVIYSPPYRESLRYR